MQEKEREIKLRLCVINCIFIKNELHFCVICGIVIDREWI